MGGSAIETHFVYDGDALVLELSPNGQPLVQYVQGLLGPIARVDLQNGANTRYYVLDARGHARAMVDSTGSVTDYYEYDSWGNVLPGSYGSTPFKWNAAAGYQHVPFTGPYHVGAREYDPRTARWLQRDPIGIASGDPNLYRYCGNNPINEDDPSGFGPEWWRRVKTWYMGGMGGLSDWVDEKIIGGATKNLGTTVGNYDCGTASGWEIAGAAAILGIEVADTATGGKKKLIKNAVQEGAEQTGKKKAKDVAADAVKVSQSEVARLRKEFDARVRPSFWKQEATKSQSKYSAENLARMKQGKPPLDNDGIPYELHHRKALSEGGLNSFENLQIKTRGDHRLGDNYRKNHPKSR